MLSDSSKGMKRTKERNQQTHLLRYAHSTCCSNVLLVPLRLKLMIFAMSMSQFVHWINMVRSRFILYINSYIVDAPRAHAFYTI